MVIQKDSSTFTMQDSIRESNGRQKSINYKISKDAIDESFNWGANYREFFDKGSNKMKLYDSAYIHYNTLDLKAGFIEFDIKKNEITGKPLEDSLGNIKQKPVFKNGEQEFTANLIKYNIKTKKGWVEYATKKEGELTVHGGMGKFISSEGDSIYHTDQMFIKNGLITNCTAEHPHWGIRASKIKLLPNKLAVFGASTIEFAGVPIYPIIIPFGFYPFFQGQKSGLILPKRLDYNQDFGVGVKDIGIYLVLNDYIDLRLTGDIYSRGTHGLYLESNYAKRYKFTGNIKLSYFNAIKENPADTSIIKSPAFNISLTHNQSPKAHPY
ncbi:MAG TPA: LPS-assembly protein LptD, partial [Bacteroidetes bacterium]|nr:LPS-assembly protein LptD [Bacteroidota bacterium]